MINLANITSQTIIDILKSSRVQEGEFCKRKINETTSFVKDLGMDSLDRYEFSYFVEETLGVSIPDEDIMGLENPKAYVDYIKAHNKQRGL